MLSYYYNNGALIIYICTIYLFYIKRHIKDSQSKIFEILLLASMTSCLFDILSEEAIHHLVDSSLWYLYLTVYIYYILQSVLTFLSSLYVLTLIDRMRHLLWKEKLLLYLPVIITSLLLMSNPWTNLFFYVDGNMNYLHGIGLGLLYVQSAYYLLLNIAYITYYRKYIARNIRVLFFAFSLLVMFFVGLELYLDHILIRNFGIAIAELLLFIAIQNSDDTLVDATGLFTYDALIARAQLDMKNKYPFSITLIKLEDKAIINYTFGLNYWFAILSEISAYLNSVGKAHSSYYLQDGLFAIMTRYDLPVEEKKRLFKKITVKFEDTKWKVLNTELSISVQLLDLSYPNNIEEINDILYYVELYSKNVVSSKSVMLSVEDLNINHKKYHAKLQKQLWNIIKNNSYELCFMPVYSVKEDRIISRIPLLKLPLDPPIYISSGELDKVTEDYRRLQQLHMKLFEDICIYMKTQSLNDNHVEYMHVNLSAVQVMRDNVLNQYKSIIEKYGIDRQRFGIELSESTVSYAQPAILQNILAMKSYGVSFILDKFGVGYTRLEYFKYIPFEFVKLDQSIVQACFINDKGLTVLKSTVAMMKQLKIKIIADGVETKEQVDLLISLGVDFLAGSYFL